MEDIKTGVYKVRGGKLYVNKGKSLECFYDSYNNLIILRPGESKFEAIYNELNLSTYFISPELWDNQRRVMEVLVRKSPVEVLIKMDRFFGVGDVVCATTVPKAYKVVYEGSVRIYVWCNREVGSILENNPFIDEIFYDKPQREFDIEVDLNTVEFKWKIRQIEELKGLKSRSFGILDNLGLYLFNRTPVVVLNGEELEWAKNKRAELGSPLIGIQRQASCKTRTYPRSDELVKWLSNKYNVVVLDEKEDGKWKYSLREMASLISVCDVVVCPDSSCLHIAGALKKPIVGLFGHTDGLIISEDYEKCSVIQGKCDSKPCWWNLDCLARSSYKEKCDVDYVKCLGSITFEEIDDEIRRHLSAKKVFICMLTYNLLEWTKKAIESIRSWYPYEIFVVDNESTDGTQEWLRENGIRFVSKKTGVASAQNIGIREFLNGDFQYFLLLNNDVVLRYDTINRLVETLEENPSIWGLSAVEVGCAPWAVDNQDTGDKIEMIRDIPASAYSCTMFTRECIEKVGEFDERFWPRYIEDNDYTLRIRLAGKNFARTDRSIFYHALGAVVKSNTEEKKKKDVHWDTNIRLYIDKWGLHPHEPQLLEKIDRRLVDRNSALYRMKELYEREGGFVLAVKRMMGGFGDHIFMSVIAKYVKDRFPNSKVVYVVPQEFFPVYENNPYVDKVTSYEDYKADICVDCTDIDYRLEMIEMAKFGKIKTHRSKIYLEYLGIFDDIKPEYYVRPEKLEWAESLWGNGKRRVAVSRYASNLLKSYPHFSMLIEELKRNGYSVIVVDEKVASGFKYAFNDAAAIIATADVVISSDSAFSNLAGALKKKTIALFGYRDGSVFAQMFPTFILVRGLCPITNSYNACDYNVKCFPGQNHRDKENIGVAPCLSNISVRNVMEALYETEGSDET